MENGKDLINKTNEAIKKSDLFPESFKANVDKIGPFSSHKKEEAIKFRDTLIKDSKFDPFLNYLRKFQKRFPFWEKNLIETQRSWFTINLIHSDIEQGILKISWPLIMDSYIRDFEALFHYIIDPWIMTHTRKNLRYHQRIKSFFSENGKLLNNLQKEALKPYIRSYLAHHIYTYDYITQKYMFIRNFKSAKTKEFSGTEMIIITKNLNELLVTFFVILAQKILAQQELLDNLNDFIKGLSQFLDTFQQRFSLEGLKYFVRIHALSCWDELPELFSDKFLGMPSKDQIHFFKIVVETFHFFSLFRGNIKNIPTEEIWNANARCTYLASYGLVMKKYVKPIYQLYHPNRILQKIPEYKLIEFCQTYNNGGFGKLFSFLDAEIRNKLAHRNYISKDQFLSELPLEQHYFLFEYNKILDPNFDHDLAAAAEGDLWFLLFSQPFNEWSPSILNELALARKKSDNAEIRFVFACLIEIRSFMQDQEKKKFIRFLKKQNQNLDQFEMFQLEFIWISLLYFLHFNSIAYSSIVYKFLLGHLKYFPSNVTFQKIFLGIRILHAEQTNKISKAYQLIKELEKLILEE